MIGSTIEKNRTIKVHGHLKNEMEANFLPGLFVEADIITNNTNAAALSETALARFNNENLILILDEETDQGYYFKKLLVEVVMTNQGYSQIKNTDAIKPED